MKTKKFLACAVLSGMGLTAVVSCSSSDDNKSSLPPIGGYNSANEVGATDLIAYWPLDGNGKESKSSTTPSSAVGDTWETGVKGQALTLNAGYLKYPSIPALATSLSSFSVSTWVKVANNGASASVFLSLAKPNDWAGNINLSAETGRAVENDSIQFKGFIKSTNALGGQDVVNIDHLDAGMINDNLTNDVDHAAFPEVVANQWVQVVVTWDGTTNMLRLYCNGVKISNPAWEKRGVPGDGNSLTFDSPTYPIIGAYSTFVDGTTTDTWNKPLTGSLDEMRVWKKSLSQAEINSLYSLELAGR
jgi:hypothetical protein